MEGNTSSSPCREQTRFACNKIIDTSIRALYQIWDKMGIDESQKKARGDTAVAHVKNLMQHMIAEEETLMKQVAQTIDEFTEKLDQLCNDLSLPHIRDKRFSEFVTTKKKITELYNLLDFEPDTSYGCELICEDDDTFGLSTDNMDSLRKLHDELVRKNENMKAETDSLWERLRSLWNRLDTFDTDREEFEMKIKGHGTKAITALKAEIEACELLKLQNIRKFIDGIRSELTSWWKKCYFSKEQRDGFKAFSKEEYTEELLRTHEQELENVQQYYNTHKDILDKIARREELFRSMIAFEEKASDPNRFFSDRGGKLLQEAKARKKLMKELPKVEEEVTETILKWENDNQKDFLVNSVKFPEYVKTSWENFQSQKEQQKQLRLKARAKQTHDEMTYGSKSVSQTPNKRKVPPSATPVRTPLKARKVEMAPSVSVKVKIQYDMLNDVTKTPSTSNKKVANSRYQHSTLTHTPVKQSVFTPKTPLSKSAKRRSARLRRKSAAKRSLSSHNRRKSRDIFMVENRRNNSSSSSLAAHGSYHDFANCVSTSKASSPDTQHI